ncbi:MAG: hypothetical protein ACRCT8_02915 [Lacipirellulaceae bacterium]
MTGNAEALPGTPVYGAQNRLLSIGGGGRSYDAEGRLGGGLPGSGAERTYVRDHRGLLEDASDASGSSRVEFQNMTATSNPASSRGALPSR